MTPATGLARPWRLPLAITLALLAVVLLGFQRSVVEMVNIWIRSATYTHAFVVPPIVVYLVWRLRARLAPLQPRPAPLMLLPIGLLAALWWVSDQVAMHSGTQFAVVAMAVCVVPLVLGWQVARVLLFPLLFCLFMVPVGDFMTPYLMHWTAEAVVLFLRWTGVPVYTEGQQLVIPSGRWAVVEACGGIRYLMSTFMVGSLFAYLNFHSARRRAQFVALSLVVPVLANWARAYMIVMLGHLSDNRLAVGVDHLVYGWVFFGIVVMALFWFGARWSEPPAPERPPVAAHTPGSRGARAGLVAVAAAGALVAGWPLLFDLLGAPAAGAAPQLQLPEQAGRWQRQPPLAELPWQPAYGGMRTQVQTRYRDADAEVGVVLSYYRDQGYDAKLVSSDNRIVISTDPRWNLLAQRLQPVGGRPAVTWRSATLQANEGAYASTLRPQLLVWELLWIGGHLTASPVEAKLWQAWLALRRQPDDAAAIHLYTVVGAEPDAGAAAQQRLARFVDENFGMLDRLLTDTRARR